MALSDCIKCWETPCACGYEYRNQSVDNRIKQASVVLGVDENLLRERIADIVPVEHPQKKD